jgi:PTH1 family peptidyl-tRNA hydrolase
MDVLFVGLGNPGPRYTNSRHNIGFRIIDAIAAMHHVAAPFKKVAAVVEISSLCMDQTKIILAKPLTFMNLSGQAVRFLVDFYKISSEKVYVFHDDIDLEFGHVKIKNGGGNGGHNGLRSIDALIGNNYSRIRIGIGRPESKALVSSHVLGDFTADEETAIQHICQRVSENIALLLSNDNKLQSESN